MKELLDPFVAETKPQFKNMGWVCPLCNGANAPSIKRCPCVPLPLQLAIE